MIKDILVAVANDEDSLEASQLARSAAEMFDAHLTAVAFAYPTTYPATTVFDVIGSGFIEEEIARNRQAASDAIRQFETNTFGNIRRPSSMILEGFPAKCANDLGKIARRFDLAVISQDNEVQPGWDMLIEALLFESGRPAVIVPTIHKGGLNLDHVAICWDGSQTAARAVGDAMPLLQRAKKISVLTVSDEEPKSKELPAADIAQHLARHGLRVELVPIHVDDVEAAQIVLSYAADREITLLVMGAYGHSRLREFVLGGMTKSMLESMTVPVFMSH